MTHNLVEIKILTKEFLKIHYNEFYKLFAENTRGHEIDKEISDSYIEKKANEIFNFMETDSTFIIGAILENKIVGILWAYKRIFLEESRIYINTLIINDTNRGLGIGKKLMAEIESVAKINNINTIDVSTSTFKKDAIKFYEDLGYTSERVQFKKELK